MSFPVMNIRHLRAVAAVIETGSTTAATRIMNLTQPAITQGVAQIEARLGTILFLRRPSGMVPTEAAQILLPRIQAALQFIGERHVTTTQINAFLALAEAGSYAAAAKNGLSEASLHRAVADLSASLGYGLVERRGRGVVLTDRGTRIARRFRLAATEMKAATEELALLDGREVGQIVVGAMPLSRARLLPAAVMNFHIQRPEVAIRVIEGSRAELIGGLRDGGIDLIVGALRLPQAPEADVVQTFLFEDRPVIIGRAGHPLVDLTTPPSDSALQKFSWLVPSRGTPLRAQWDAMFDAIGVAPPRAPIECGSVMMVRQMLLASDFLTLLSPDQLAVELDAGILVRIADAPGDVSRHIGVTLRAEWRPPPIHRAFLAALEEEAKLILETDTVRNP